MDASGTPLAWLPRCVVALVLLGLSSCGNEGNGGSAPAGREMPGDPVAALAWVTEAGRTASQAELDRRLSLWPLDDDAFAGTEETQTVLTWRLQRALAADRIKDARDQYQMLRRDFGGEGRTRLGRRMTSYMLRVGLAAACSKAARAAIEGGRPDPDRAAFALDLARRYLPENEEEDAALLAGLERWVALDRLEGLGLVLPAHAGPRVVAIVDTFALGEAVLPSVLGRWQRQHRDKGLQVTLVPVRTGQVRVGLRRVPVERPAEEQAVFRAAAKAGKLTIAPATDPALARSFGRDQGHCLLVLADRRGRIVARLSGHTLDPLSLEALLQRVVSR